MYNSKICSEVDFRAELHITEIVMWFSKSSKYVKYLKRIPGLFIL